MDGGAAQGGLVSPHSQSWVCQEGELEDAGDGTETWDDEDTPEPFSSQKEHVGEGRPPLKSFPSNCGMCCCRKTHQGDNRQAGKNPSGAWR